MKNKQYSVVLIGIIFICAIFRQFLLHGNLPIPADNIIGLFHPYRDVYEKIYPHGIPFKNALLTDPVEQQYPWKAFSTHLLSELQMPVWNPYSFSGTPLLANFQSSPFYIVNILFFIFPFK